MPRGSAQRGFTYVWVLALIATLGAALSVAGPRWADEARREQERELLRVGMLYARAIRSYHDVSPGSLKQHPPSLDALLQDKRLVGTYRHLRKLYGDPMAAAHGWGLVLGEDGSIRGVYSRSSGAPLRSEALDLGLVKLPAARNYSEWKFIPEIPS